MTANTDQPRAMSPSQINRLVDERIPYWKRLPSTRPTENSVLVNLAGNTQWVSFQAFLDILDREVAAEVPK